MKLMVMMTMMVVMVMTAKCWWCGNGGVVVWPRRATLARIEEEAGGLCHPTSSLQHFFSYHRCHNLTTSELVVPPAHSNTYHTKNIFLTPQICHRLLHFIWDEHLRSGHGGEPRYFVPNSYLRSLWTHHIKRHMLELDPSSQTKPTGVRSGSIHPSWAHSGQFFSSPLFITRNIGCLAALLWCLANYL